MKMAAGATVLCAFISLAPAGSLMSQDPSSSQRPTGRVDRRECAGCHPEVKAHKETHGPVVVDACASCHRTDSAERHTFLTPENVCFQCHDAGPAEGPVTHAPVASGECLGCHDPHGGADKAMLGASSVDELCRACHDDVGLGAKEVHGRGTRCTDCHLAHAANHAKLLRRSPDKLCRGCHEPIQRKIESARVGHSPTTDDRGCRNCHAPHATGHSSLLVSEVNALCLSCHDRELERAGGGTLGNIQAELDGAVHVHEPVADGDCSSCHDGHGSGESWLLNAAYPAGLYADFREEAYALCFGCHDSEMITAEATTAATGFRNGDVNLHNVHVGKRRTCLFCHRTHAGPNDRLVRSSVAYGRAAYNVTIGFERTADGGSCAKTCHAPTAYDRTASREERQP